MRSVFIILFILVSSQIAFPQQNSGRKYYFVAAKTGLVMRKTPSSDAEKLNVLPYAARVKVVDENGPVEKIGGKNAKWFKITDDYHYSFAWVFSGFLVSGLDELDQSRFEVFAMKFFFAGRCP